jgi:hypothetical protein
MPAAVACWVETSTPPMAMAGRSSGHTAQSSVLTGGTIEERKGQSLLAESQEQGSRQSDSTPVLTLDETLTDRHDAPTRLSTPSGASGPTTTQPHRKTASRATKLVPGGPQTLIPRPKTDKASCSPLHWLRGAWRQRLQRGTQRSPIRSLLCASQA